MNFTTFDKAIVAGVGMLLIILNAVEGVNAGLSPTQQGLVSLAIAILTPVAVYLKANKPS